MCPSVGVPSFWLFCFFACHVRQTSVGSWGVKEAPCIGHGLGAPRRHEAERWKREPGPQAVANEKAAYDASQRARGHARDHGVQGTTKDCHGRRALAGGKNQQGGIRGGGALGDRLVTETQGAGVRRAPNDRSGCSRAGTQGGRGGVARAEGRCTAPKGRAHQKAPRRIRAGAASQNSRRWGGMQFGVGRGGREAQRAVKGCIHSVHGVRGGAPAVLHGHRRPQAGGRSWSARARTRALGGTAAARCARTATRRRGGRKSKEALVMGGWGKGPAGCATSLGMRRRGPAQIAPTAAVHPIDG